MMMATATAVALTVLAVTAEPASAALNAYMKLKGQ